MCQCDDVIRRDDYAARRRYATALCDDAMRRRYTTTLCDDAMRRRNGLSVASRRDEPDLYNKNSFRREFHPPKKLFCLDILTDILPCQTQ